METIINIQKSEFDPAIGPAPRSEIRTYEGAPGFHREGKRIKSFLKAFKAACKAAGYPGHIPHDFRRTAVRNLVRAGVNETVAMKMTGHKTRSVFERYNIVSDGYLRDAARKLNAARNAAVIKRPV